MLLKLLFAMWARPADHQSFDRTHQLLGAVADTVFEEGLHSLAVVDVLRPVTSKDQQIRKPFPAAMETSAVSPSNR